MSQASNAIFALIVATSKEIDRAREAGDQASAAKLEQLRDELKRKEATMVLLDAAAAAAELSELAARLEQSKREIDEATNSFFLGDLGKAKHAIEAEAAELDQQVRPAPAPEEPDLMVSGLTDTIPLTIRNDEGVELDIPPKETEEYVTCFEALEFRSKWQEKADAAVARIVRDDAAARYRRVEQMTGVPWWVVGILHMMETSQRFNAHLHNGDPLSAKTVRVPAGRPVGWQSGMVWEMSAEDALTNGSHRLHEVEDWSVGNALRIMECYNGLGYRQRKRMSPYLWCGSTFFEKGKFIADGCFDPEAFSAQVGCALLLRRLADKGYFSISSQNVVNSKPAAVLGSSDLADMTFSIFEHAKEEVEFPLSANGTMRKGYGGSTATEKEKKAVWRIQEWCCLHGCKTGIDGDFGPSTELAVKLFQFRQSLPETGAVDRQTWTLLTAPMRRAIAPVTREGDLNSAVIAVAKQHLAQIPKEVGGNNKGPWVRLYMKGQDGEERRWCAGFVCSLVQQAAKDLGGEMPFTRHVGVDELVNDAKASGRFIAESAIGDPMVRKTKIVPGSLFVIRETETDWTHVGIVTEMGVDSFLTIEGNTNGDNVDGGNATYASRAVARKDYLVLV